MNRVVFLIDGFNVYHSIRQALKDRGGSCLQLDLESRNSPTGEWLGPLTLKQ